MKKTNKQKINELLLKVFFLICGTLFLINMIPHVAKAISDGAVQSINHKK